MVCDLFDGNHPGYRRCRTEYHDLAHTLDTFLAAARLADGRLLSGHPLSAARIELLLIAALFHDTGYIQENCDLTGTGAQYTKSHVARSCTFVKKNASAFLLSETEADAVGDLILFTDLGFSPDEDLCEEDLVTGQILGTADLIGQMADRTYLEKLLFLYYEFREGGVAGFDTSFDILKKTRLFYAQTSSRLDTALGRTYSYAQEHFRTRLGVDANLYTEAIARHMSYLQSIIDDENTNFRTKLKRIDIVSRETPYLAINQ